MPITSSISRSALTFALCIAALSAAAPATAAEPREIRISVDRAELAARQDVDALNADILRAARAVCRRPSYATETALNQRSCVADTVRRAWAQIDRANAEQAGFAQVAGLQAP